MDCIVAMPDKLFFNTGIPVSLWFISKERHGNGHRERRGEVLFIDARKLGTMESRRLRTLDDSDISTIADTYHSWRNHDGEYADVPGFTKAAKFDEIQQHDFVLSPGATSARQRPKRMMSRSRRRSSASPLSCSRSSNTGANLRMRSIAARRFRVVTIGWNPTRLGEVVKIKQGFAFSGMAENADLKPPCRSRDWQLRLRRRLSIWFDERQAVHRKLPARVHADPQVMSSIAMTCQTAGGEILGVPGTVPDDGQTYLHNQRLGKVEVLDPTRIDLRFFFQLARWQPFNHHLFATASVSKNSSYVAGPD